MTCIRFIDLTSLTLLFEGPFSFIIAIVSPMIQLDTSFGFPHAATACSNRSAMGFSSVRMPASYFGRPNSL